MTGDVARKTPLADPNRTGGVVFLPHRPFRLDAWLPLRVAQWSVDGRPCGLEGVEEERRRVRADGLGPWKSLSLRFALEDRSEALAREAFPEASARGAAPEVRFVLSVRGPATRLRRGVAFEAGGDGTLEAELRLGREEVEGRVQVEALAVLGEARPEARGSDEAFALHALLARSPLWIVDFQGADPPPGRGIDTVWVDFADPKPDPPYRGEDASLLRACPEALSHVVFRPEGPLLLLNAHHAEVRETLLAPGTHGLRARLRDALLDRIGVETWRAILTEAALRLLGPAVSDGDEEEAEPAALGEDHWAVRALETAAERARSEPGRLLAEWRDEERRPGRLFELAERLGRVGRQPAFRLVREVQGR